MARKARHYFGPAEILVQRMTHVVEHGGSIVNPERWNEKGQRDLLEMRNAGAHQSS
jgi:hypothetical protein